MVYDSVFYILLQRNAKGNVATSIMNSFVQQVITYCINFKKNTELCAIKVVFWSNNPNAAMTTGSLTCRTGI